LGGQGDIGIIASSIVAPHAGAGRLRALAVTSAQRTAMMPGLPTIAETPGLAGYDITSWLGVVAPVSTPPEIINRLSATMAKIVSAADSKERFAALGFESVSNTPEQFAVFIKAEVEKFARLAKLAGIKPEQ